MFLKTFGKLPSGEELNKIEASPNYRDKSFQNLVPAKLFVDESMMKILWKFMTKKNASPANPLPSIKTNLKNLPDNSPVIIWFGHSSYLIKISGKYILVDPVFSGHASPFSFTTKSFAGTDIYNVEDLPEIDVLLISHDHYDHLDYKTVRQLIPKTKMVCTSLGVASHLIYWGFDKNKIIEFDWWNEHLLFDDLKFTAVPARHFSGRTFIRNKTLWSAFVLQTNKYNLFLGADSGYGDHFKLIHEKFPSFDIAILECGQYNIAWHDIHMLPEETAQACIDLHAKVLMPVHWGKFSLSLHTWDEPIKRVCKKAAELKIKLTTPMIGEPVIIDKTYPDKRWWQETN
ncbi:MAG TPA: MBL fold metallo-hydrolase [Parafilimonas sp.]|nr:MBL fold metallo-hydrolase [Parafilimonas sp.]